MARLPRLVVPGRLHLLLQRSHAGTPVLRGDDDCAAYRRALFEAAAAHGVAIHAYALTPSQVLMLVTPSSATGPSRMLQGVGRRFGADYNRRHGRSGALWDGRFRTTVVDDTLLLDCLRYVESAPWRLGLAAAATGYAWSSADHHVGMRLDSAITEHPRFWTLGNTPFEREANYRQLLEQPPSGEFEARLESAATKGWALGDATFLRQLADQTARRVAPLARGRPKQPSHKTVPK